MRKYIQKISEYAIAGGVGAVLLFGLSGCEEKVEDRSTFAQKEGAMVVIEEVRPGEYRIVEEQPSSSTRVILRDVNGTERILSQEEIEELVRQGARMAQEGKSALTNPQIHSGGMSLGEVILASAAGAIVGSWIGSKLFGNQTYQARRHESYKSPTVYERSVQRFEDRHIKKATQRKSGFFGQNKQHSAASFSFGG
jgi:hypothetical protein